MKINFKDEALLINNELVNNPAGGAKETGGRYVITGWGLLSN